jgi:hypothetical protein
MNDKLKKIMYIKDRWELFRWKRARGEFLTGKEKGFITMNERENMLDFLVEFCFKTLAEVKDG